MPIDRKIFFDRIRAEPFGGFLSGSQVSGVSAILDVWDKRGGGDPRHLAYPLGTTFLETDRTMQPIEEYGHGKGRAYGVPAGPWHLVYDGRGDVQLTWEGNYAKATTRLRALGFDVDLEQHPEQAMRPDVAAMILIVGMAEGWFTGSALGHWFSPTVDDPVNARRIINGTDKADVVAGYHRQFLAAVKAAMEVGATSELVAARVPPGPDPTVERALAAPKTTVAAKPAPLIPPRPDLAGPLPTRAPASAGVPARSWWAWLTRKTVA